MNNKHIIPECHLDTLLIESVLASNDFNHKKGLPNVWKTMNKKFLDEAALCVIDNDKDKTEEFKHYSKLTKHNEHLSIYKHKAKAHYAIVLGSKHKAVEDFIIHNAERCGINLSDFHLPNKISGWTKAPKRAFVENNMPNLKRLFSAIKKNPSSDFRTLANWIKQFKANPYDLNINSL